MTQPVYGLTPESRDNYRFTCGDCHILAKRISKVTGWPIATFTDIDDDPTMHAFVIHPSGGIVDVNGLQDRSDFIERWGARGLGIREWTWESLRASTWWTPPKFGRYSYVRARVIAGRILDSLDGAAAKR